MANDIIDINVYETNDSVEITVQPNLTTVNITQVNAGNGNLPVGGTEGQVLAKIDSANFNTQWVNQSGGGGGISDAPNDSNAYVRSALSWVIGYTKSAIDTLLGNKVDKVTGKGLSTEDYTITEKNKLSGIAAGAEVNVNADWNATSGDAQILNKPTIPSENNLVPYTGATADVDLGTRDIYLERVFLNDSVNGGSASLHFADNDFHIEDADGHKMLVIEDGFIQLHKTDTIQSNLYTSGLSQTRDHYLPNASGTLALTSDLNLNGLSDVEIISLFNGDVLQYESATQLWKNKNLLVGDADFGNDNNTYNSTLLSTLFASVDSTINLKQDALVSGTNIKTVNGNSLIGSGNLVILSSPASQSAYTMLANNTSASAIPTEQPFENLTNQTYSGTIVWTGGTAPSGATQHTYSLSQIGNLVTLVINLSYATAGAITLTSVACELSNTAPTPALPPSVTAVGDILNYGIGSIFATKTLPGTNTAICGLRIKSLGTPNVYEVAVARTTAAYRYAYITIQYFV